MYDARFGRWLSIDPYGQFWSPYVGMGNAPNMGVDPDGGWSWVTAGIGFAAGAAIGYATTGDWQGALAGGVAGGLLGGASFSTQSRLISAGSQTSWMSVEKSLVLSGFGKSVVASAPNIASSATRALVQAGSESKNFHYFTDEGKAIQFMINMQSHAISEFQKEVLYKDKPNDTKEGIVVVRYLPNDTCQIFTITSIISDYNIKNRLPSHHTFVKGHLVFMYTGYEGIFAMPDHYFDSLKRYYKNKLEEVTQPEELAEIKVDTSDFVPIEIGSSYDPPTWYVNYCDSTVNKSLYK